MGAREAIALCSFSSFTAPYLEALSSRDNNMSWRAVKDFRERKRLLVTNPVRPWVHGLTLLRSGAGIPPCDGLRGRARGDEAAAADR